MTDAQPRPPTKKPWWNLLPQETAYRDTGCRLHPSCLACPFPRCAEDAPRGMQHFRLARFTVLTHHLLGRGYTQAQIAQLLGVSERTVRRYKNGRRTRPTNRKAPESCPLSQRRNTR